MVIILINLAVGILPHVDNFAHIGGFLSGFLLGFVLLVRPQFAWQERRHLPVEARGKSKYTVFQYVFWILSMILLIAGYASIDHYLLSYLFLSMVTLTFEVRLITLKKRIGY